MSIFIKISSIWTTPSPSQRPIDPPKSARNVEELNSLNPIRFSCTFLLKLITIDDTFFFQDVEAVIVPLVAVDLEMGNHCKSVSISHKISKYLQGFLHLGSVVPSNNSHSVSSKSSKFLGTACFVISLWSFVTQNGVTPRLFVTLLMKLVSHSS